jgi:hypothetical protein
MNRCLIFLASLMLTFVAISSASGASARDWGRAAIGANAAERAGAGHWSAARLAVTPSRLIAIDVIGL